MKKTVLILLMLSSPAAPGRSDVMNEQAEATVMTLENAWNQAVRLKESRALQPLLLQDLIYIEGDGRLMNKEQYLAEVSAPIIHPAHVVTEQMRAHSYGAAVIVTGVYRENGIRRRDPYTLRERFIDTWVRQHGVWVCVVSQSTRITH